jgi:proline iminopeptidase
MDTHVLAVDGLRINAAEWGAGPPVVLLHGLTGSLDYWAPFAERLGRRHRVIALDVPGHGLSDALDPFTFEEVVEVLERATDRLGVSEPALVGHSFGAPIAVCWAAERPVSALVLASPVGLVPIDLRRARMVLPLRRVLARSVGMWEGAVARGRLGRRVVFGWFVGMSRLDVLDPAAARGLIRGAAHAAAVVPALLPALDSLDLESVLPRVSARSLVIWGEHDRAGWENGPGLADALGGEELVLPAVGHMPMIEAPYSFGRAVEEFLRAPG